MTVPTGRERLTVFVIASVILCAAWFAYKPALGGSFLLDDLSNLGDLPNIDDARSALQFIFSGSAGPLGRPLALATFLPQASSWEGGAAPFLVVNILLHLFNGLLVGWFLYRLTRTVKGNQTDARVVALSAMALWLFMPLLASASLMVVQRMTTLSATFVLLGLHAYLIARHLAARRESKALAGMTLSILVAGVLAALSKESGLLLPVLVLVMELTILQRPEAIDRAKWRNWVTAALALPTAAVILYLIWRVPYAEEVALRRDFTAWERLLTQSRVLWEYLLNAFLPRPGRFGPYHEAYPVARDLLVPSTFISVTSWIAISAFAIIWRRKYSIVAFGVLWFLAGHLLESTTIPLEMYFEHRNYLPIVGPIFSIVYLATCVPQQFAYLVRMGLPLYILVNALFLFGQATLWGDPQLASRYWYGTSPHSVRAATAMATEQLSLEGAAGAIRTLRGFAKEHPGHGYVRIPELNLSCIIEPEGEHQAIVQSLRTTLPEVSFSYTAGRMLSELMSTVIRGSCEEVDVNVVEELAEQLLSNPRYKQDSTYNQYHQQLMARLARHRGDVEQTLSHLRQAIEFKPTADLNMMMVTTMVSDKRFDEARDYIRRASKGAPIQPFRRHLWNSGLEELKMYIEAAEADLENREIG